MGGLSMDLFIETSVTLFVEYNEKKEFFAVNKSIT